MTKIINHEQFKEIIEIFYNSKNEKTGKKIPLIVYGTFGIGKSSIISKKAQEIAEKKNKIFINWNEITREQKNKILENPSEYFILMDIRLSEFDSTDIKGLPDFKKDDDNHSIEWKTPFWAKILENPESDGILFFDEMNLAIPIVISSTYKIFHDRIINDGKINENWLIIGAGNKEDDNANVNELAYPIRDRAGEIELNFSDIDNWTEWAIKNEIDNRIIGYLNYQPSKLHQADFKDNQKFTTERGWERLSTLIKNKDFNTLELISGVAIGEGIAREFIAFCDIENKIKIDEIIKKPEMIKDIKEISTKYFLISSLAEQYGKEKIEFKSLLEIIKVLDKYDSNEFVTILLRLSLKYNPKKFKENFKNSNDKILKKYIKYLIIDTD
jgi:hypothetical protein